MPAGPHHDTSDNGAHPRGDPPEVHGPLRQGFSAELEQLRLQTELMGVRVEQNVVLMRRILDTGDADLAARAVAADDDIDAMNVSLTERCYRLLAQETPVAGDLRLVVSVVRIISELERVGDLCLRVVKVAPDHDLLAADEQVFAILQDMADEAVDAFQAVLRAWATLDVDLATQLATGPRPVDRSYEELTTALFALSGDRAVPAALAVVAVARALERIVDHAGIIGSRIRYLITGDPGHLAAEVR